jgi:hypothetical protein
MAESGAENVFQPETAGDHIVELRTVENSPTADATCDFAVVSDVIIDEKECKDDEVAVGAHIAFLIDNSNSNSATDCPSRRQIGNEQGVDLFECQAQTNREIAVLSAYEELAKVAERRNSNNLSSSNVAIASFPAKNSTTDWRIHSNGWMTAKSSDLNNVSSVMSFARQPFGITPYGAAMEAGRNLFNNVRNDGRAKVAVLVTDGEPTDRDPNSVASLGQALQSSGVKVITVFLTQGERRSEREAQHVSMLENFEAVYQRANQHWFDSRVFSSFNDYINNLLGRNGQLSLIDRITSKQVASCQDGSTRCGREIVSVSDSSQLRAAFTNIIRSKAVQCVAK